MWGRVILAAVIVTLTILWLGATSFLLLDDGTFLQKWERGLWNSANGLFDTRVQTPKMKSAIKNSPAMSIGRPTTIKKTYAPARSGSSSVYRNVEYLANAAVSKTRKIKPITKNSTFAAATRWPLEHLILTSNYIGTSRSA